MAFCCDEVQILGALGGLVAMWWPFWIIGGSPLCRGANKPTILVGYPHLWKAPFMDFGRSPL